MARQVTISVTGATTTVKIVENGTTQIISNKGNRNFTVTPTGIQFGVAPDDRGLNNMHIALAELTDDFGATTPEELEVKLTEIGAFTDGLSITNTVEEMDLNKIINNVKIADLRWGKSDTTYGEPNYYELPNTTFNNGLPVLVYNLAVYFSNIDFFQKFDTVKIGFRRYKPRKIITSESNILRAGFKKVYTTTGNLLPQKFQVVTFDQHTYFGNDNNNQVYFAKGFSSGRGSNTNKKMVTTGETTLKSAWVVLGLVLIGEKDGVEYTSDILTKIKISGTEFAYPVNKNIITFKQI